MQVQKIQSEQLNFGTKVKIDPRAARMMSLTNATSKILNEIKQLESNGNDDILSLSVTQNPVSYIKASVFEKKDNKISVSFYSPIEQLETLKDGKKQYISIKQLYQQAKKNLVEVVINKKEFEEFIQYIG